MAGRKVKECKVCGGRVTQGTKQNPTAYCWKCGKMYTSDQFTKLGIASEARQRRRDVRAPIKGVRAPIDKVKTFL